MALAAALAACSTDGPDRVSPGLTTTVAPAPSTSSTSSSTSTTVVPTTTAPPRPTTTAPASSPEGFARALYVAWTGGDQAAAGKVAEPQAVAALFARPWLAGDGWTFSECTGAAGSIICTWQRPAGQQVLLRVQNRTGGLPVTVSEVRFQP